MNRLCCAAPLFLLAWCVAGCTPPGQPTPAAGKVKGTVNLDGKPMDGGEVRFSVPGQPAKIIEIKGGSFSGEAFVGKNQIDVVWEKDGPPHPMDPKMFLKVNTVSDKFSGPTSSLNTDVKAGDNDFKFEVTSAK